MPSSLIIVALAAAWLVVLVPMIARSRQEVARTADSALAARVVRSGGGRRERGKEFAMSETEHASRMLDDDHFDDEPDELDEVDEVAEPEPRRAEQRPGRYRPGRGGFDPEAAEIAARAKYGFRQRVVVGLLITVVITAVLAIVMLPMVWWVNGIADVALVGYLGYLRRQVRIENEIRDRRMARLGGAGSPPVRDFVEREHPAEGELAEHDDTADEREDVEVIRESPYRATAAERRPAAPSPRLRRQAVYVDLEDEDPAFHELDEPGELPFRRASGQ